MQRRQLMRHIWLSSWEAGTLLHKSAVAEDVWQACLWRKHSHHLHLPLGFIVSLRGPELTTLAGSGAKEDVTGMMKGSSNLKIILRLNDPWRLNIIHKVETGVYIWLYPGCGSDSLCLHIKSLHLFKPGFGVFFYVFNSTKGSYGYL